MTGTGADTGTSGSGVPLGVRPAPWALRRNAPSTMATATAAATKTPRRALRKLPMSRAPALQTIAALAPPSTHSPTPHSSPVPQQ